MIHVVLSAMMPSYRSHGKWMLTDLSGSIGHHISDSVAFTTSSVRGVHWRTQVG